MHGRDAIGFNSKPIRVNIIQDLAVAIESSGPNSDQCHSDQCDYHTLH